MLLLGGAPHGAPFDIAVPAERHALLSSLAFVSILRIGDAMSVSLHLSNGCTALYLQQALADGAMS